MLDFGPAVLDRMVRAVEKVRERLLRSTSILEAAGIPYAVIGGNCVAAWVARVDEAAVRNTRDVDLLLRREDLPAAIIAMEHEGFIHRRGAGIDMFLDGPGAKARDAVHLIFSEEKVRTDDPLAAPSVEESVGNPDGRYRHLTLEALVRMKLVANRLKDQVHLQDLTILGLIDASWPAKFPEPLKSRLEAVLNGPLDSLDRDLDAE